MPDHARGDPAMTRRKFIQATGAGALGAVGAAAVGCKGTRAAEEPPATPLRRKPNIIFILADDLGYGDLGCYGQKKIRTPNLDRLAAEGIRFTQAYSGSTVCAPSRCCLMTGLHTGHAHIRGNALVPLRPEDKTVAEVLKEAGYATGLVGKWGLGEPDTAGIPNKKGFDCFYGYLNQAHAHNYYPDYLWKNTEKVRLGNEVEKGVAVRRAEYSADLFTKEALAFVEEHRREPFFLYLAYTIPHANNEAGKQGMEVPGDEPYTGESWPQNEKNFAAMVTRMDTDVGRLLEKLQELAIDRDTVVLFTSDNGPHKEGGHDPTFFASSGPVRGTKRNLTDGGIRVPMIVRWAGRIPAGTVSDQVWAFWDFLPTAAEIAGAPGSDGIDGISMLPCFLGRPQKSHEYLYWEFFEGGFQQAVRLGDWKGIRKGLDGKLVLYNLKTDLDETDDVADANPDVVKQIEAILKSARTDSAAFPIRPPAKKPAPPADAGKAATP